MKTNLLKKLTPSRARKSRSPVATPTPPANLKLPAGIYFAAAVGIQTPYPAPAGWLTLFAYLRQPGFGNKIVSLQATSPELSEFRIKMNGNKVTIVASSLWKGDLELWHSFSQVHEIPDQERRLILFSEQEAQPLEPATAKALFDFMVTPLD
jgi:hypothetical protein